MDTAKENAKHIAEELVYQWVFDNLTPTTTEQEHLAACAACHAQLVAVQRLAGELQIAQASKPSAAALTRYSQLYTHVEQAPTLVEQLATFITATLQWDGRRQPAWQGVRNSHVASYRLLYATAQAEIELLVVPSEGAFAIEGEIIPGQEATDLLPMRCELQNMASGETVTMAESQANGRFRLSHTPAAHYRLFFTPQHGPAIVIDDLELP
ncbi:MAG: hypothetical protein R3E79_24405 [Caldilineaceae bacterium]